ncbi:hypothetical protein LINPERPRIM_LOCUS43671 [Linum perenne]
MASVKFLCSYGGQILPPRPGESKLRYSGGVTRVLSVDLSSTSFSDLLLKLADFCGATACSVELRCQLPNGDLETLVSVKSDEELAAVVEEYDRVSPGSKIRAVLCLPKPLDHLQNDKIKIVSPPHSVIGSFSAKKLPRPRRRCYPDDVVAVGHPVGLYNRYRYGYANPRVSYGNPVCDCSSWRN